MNMKKILIFGVLGLVVVGGGAGAYLYLKKAGGGHEPEQPQAEGPVQAAEPSAEPPAQSPAQPPAQPVQANANYSPTTDVYEDDGTEVVAVTQSHTINLPGDGTSGSRSRSSFLRCQVSILVRDTELGKAMASDTPTPEREAAKAVVLDALSALTMEDVTDQEVRSILKQDILNALNARFKNRPPPKEKKAPPRPAIPIKEVLIVEWAIQY